VLAFIFLYVSIISTENGVNNHGDLVLVAIAIYGTSFMLLKTSLAVYSQLKWLLCGRRRANGSQGKDQNRLSNIDEYWRKEFDEWNREHSQQSLVSQGSVIEMKIK
jgi:hypothetical protein